MKDHRLVIREVDRNIFNQLTDGSKKIETRAATPKYRQVMVGDTLTFVCGANSLTKRVTGVTYCADIDDLYQQFPISNVLPGITNISNAKQLHYSFPGYKQKLERFGVMAFTLEATTPVQLLQ